MDLSTHQSVLLWSLLLRASFRKCRNNAERSRTDLHIREQTDIILQAKNSVFLYRPAWPQKWDILPVSTLAVRVRSKNHNLVRPNSSFYLLGYRRNQRIVYLFTNTTLTLPQFLQCQNPCFMIFLHFLWWYAGCPSPSELYFYGMAVTSREGA